MQEILLADEVFKLTEAAAFLKKSPRTVRGLIKSGKLIAGKSGEKAQGRFEILKSSCLEYVHNQKHNQAVSESDGRKEDNLWRSNNVVEFGTATSQRQTESVLGGLLTRQTSSKRRSCTTN